jgi:rRNA maturation RNase YbeY
MKIFFDTVNTDKPQIDSNKISSWINFVVSDNKKKLRELSIVFCDNEYIIEINKKFLKHDYYTDIITFDYSEKNYISGDLLICTEIVKYNAKKFKVKFDDELNRVIIHGILHLLGFNDKTPETKSLMTQKEDYYLNLLTNIN